MNVLLRLPLSRQRGAVLIIVLAFVVLLTGLTVAYYSRATSDRQVAHSSFNQTNVDRLAQSAMDLRKKSKPMRLSDHVRILRHSAARVLDGRGTVASMVTSNGKMKRNF